DHPADRLRPEPGLQGLASGRCPRLLSRAAPRAAILRPMATADPLDTTWGTHLPGLAPIDCDVHAVVPSVEALFPYLRAFWRESISQSGFKAPIDPPSPRAPTSARAGSAPEKGPPGSSLDRLRQQALDPWGSQLAILNCSYAVESIHNP